MELAAKHSQTMGPAKSAHQSLKSSTPHPKIYTQSVTLAGDFANANSALLPAGQHRVWKSAHVFALATIPTQLSISV
jgi:hypothetical protein